MLPARDANGKFSDGNQSTRTHGMSRTKIYSVWNSMMRRCYTPSATGYDNYGGRGIEVCDRWHDFTAFYADMGECHPGMSIDRIDPNGNYEPANCRWASRLEQNRNQRDLRWLTHNGKTQCVAAWADESGIPASTILARLRKGWSVDRIISTPVREHKEYRRATR